jgi:hypothetical protein
MGEAKRRGSFLDRMKQSQEMAVEAAKIVTERTAAWQKEVSEISQRIGLHMGTAQIMQHAGKNQPPRPARVVLVGLDELLARVQFWTSGATAAPTAAPMPSADPLRVELEAQVPAESAVPAMPDDSAEPAMPEEVPR